MDDQLRRLQREDEEAWYRAALRAGLFTENHSYVKSVMEALCAKCEINTLRWSNCSYCYDCHRDTCRPDDVEPHILVGIIRHGDDVITTRFEVACYE